MPRQRRAGFHDRIVSCRVKRVIGPAAVGLIGAGDERLLKASIIRNIGKDKAGRVGRLRCLVPSVRPASAEHPAPYG